MILVAGIAAVGLTGCERLEQTATEAVGNAKQAAAEALDEARQAGSIADVKQSADKLLNETKQQAAGLLEQASQFLSESQQALETVQPPEETGSDAL